ncbi:unnamed protein product [Oreochromis niloticus]|nr:unnamed protein product [Mustela putorius furo]
MFCFCGLKAPHFLCFLALVFGTSGHENDELVGPFRVEDGVKLNSQSYCQFLEDTFFKQWYRKKSASFKKNMIFMQDNAPSHASKYSTAWLARKGIKEEKLMTWPPCSPDLNPIENLWSIIKCEIYKEGKQYTSLNSVWEAVVAAARNVDGAAPKPVVWLVKETEDQVQLHCVVLGAFPKPKVQWKDSDGNIFPAEEPQVLYRGDRYYITLLTTVTATNTSLFHCVATQEEIGHVIEAEIRVPDNPFKSSYGGGVLAGLFSAGFVIGASVVLVLCAFYVRKNYIKKGNFMIVDCRRFLSHVDINIPDTLSFLL